MVDVEKVAKALENEPNVVVSKTAAFMCSSTPQNMIKEDIETLGLNRIVVGA
ncbi:MAG: hypothetical protein ACFFCM_02790 [Promethearchaeota archaeon]